MVVVGARQARAVPGAAATLERPCCRVQVPFDQNMFPTGNVEAWLGVVEQRMKSSLRTQIIESMKARAVGRAVV